MSSTPPPRDPREPDLSTDEGSEYFRRKLRRIHRLLGLRRRGQTARGEMWQRGVSVRIHHSLLSPMRWCVHACACVCMHTRCDIPPQVSSLQPSLLRYSARSGCESVTIIITGPRLESPGESCPSFAIRPGCLWMASRTIVHMCPNAHYTRDQSSNTCPWPSRQVETAKTMNTRRPRLPVSMLLTPYRRTSPHHAPSRVPNRHV